MVTRRLSLSSVSTLAAALCCAAIAAHPRVARASDTQLGLDLQYSIPADTLGDPGWGFAVRVGSQFGAPGLKLTPELAFGYDAFEGRGEPTAYRGVAGLRLGIGEAFRIGPFVHLGLGRLEAEAGGLDYSHTALAFDLGAFFDFTLLPLLNVGVHAAYNQIGGDGSGPFEWITLGAHGELIL